MNFAPFFQILLKEKGRYLGIILVTDSLCISPASHTLNACSEYSIVQYIRTQSYLSWSPRTAVYQPSTEF